MCFYVALHALVTQNECQKCVAHKHTLCDHPWVSPPRRSSFRWWMPLCSTVKHLSIVFMIMAAQITAIFLFIGLPLLSVGVVINIVRMADSDPTAIYQSKNSLIICTYDLGINITTAAITDSREKPNAETSSADLETTECVCVCVRLKNWVETRRDHTHTHTPLVHAMK